MQTITATTPCLNPPTWATLERTLIDLMNESVYPFLQKYTREDGTLIWRDTWYTSRDGADDCYESSYNWGPGMRVYGLPFHDLPGINHYDDLQDPAKARLMGETMQQRMGQGDVAGNLIVTSLIANAYLMTGDRKYHDWIVEYVDAWV